MELKKHDDAIAVLGGKAMLRAEHSPRDGATGEVSLRLEDQETFEVTETVLAIDPWSPDGFEVYDWWACQVLVVCSSRQIAALVTTTLEVISAVALEYGEGETIDRPWFLEIPTLKRLVVATERRVWCLDEHGAIRWIWSTRYDASERWIIDAPRFVDREIYIPVRMMSGESDVVLSDLGMER